MKYIIVFATLLLSTPASADQFRLSMRFECWQVSEQVAPIWLTTPSGPYEITITDKDVVIKGKRPSDMVAFVVAKIGDWLCINPHKQISRYESTEFQKIFERVQ